MKSDRMRAVQVPHPNGPFELVEREIPEPGPGAVRLKVQACGICHSDSLDQGGDLSRASNIPGFQGMKSPA